MTDKLNLYGLLAELKNYDIYTGKQCKNLVIEIRGESNGQHVLVKMPDGKTKKVPSANIYLPQKYLIPFIEAHDEEVIKSKKENREMNDEWRIKYKEHTHSEKEIKNE